MQEAYENEYETAYEIGKFKPILSDALDDFYFRLPFYVQGERDASVLISVDKNNKTSDVYEISEYADRIIALHLLFICKLFQNT